MDELLMETNSDTLNHCIQRVLKSVYQYQNPADIKTLLEQFPSLFLREFLKVVHSYCQSSKRDERNPARTLKKHIQTLMSDRSVPQTMKCIRRYDLDFSPALKLANDKNIV